MQLKSLLTFCFFFFYICMVEWRFSWHESLDRLKLSTSLFFDYQEFPIIWRYINCATRVVSLSLQPREFIRLTMRWKRGAGSLCELFIALWLNSNHFSRVTDREMLSALIEGIDFPTPFGAHWRDTIRGFGFQKKNLFICLNHLIDNQHQDWGSSTKPLPMSLFSFFHWITDLLSQGDLNRFEREQ